MFFKKLLNKRSFFKGLAQEVSFLYSSHKNAKICGSSLIVNQCGQLLAKITFFRKINVVNETLKQLIFNFKSWKETVQLATLFRSCEEWMLWQEIWPGCWSWWCERHLQLQRRLRSKGTIPQVSNFLLFGIFFPSLAESSFKNQLEIGEHHFLHQISAEKK